MRESRRALGSRRHRRPESKDRLVRRDAGDGCEPLGNVGLRLATSVKTKNGLASWSSKREQLILPENWTLRSSDSDESPNELKLSDGGRKRKELGADATPPFAGARC